MSRLLGLGLVLVMGLVFAFMNRAEPVDPYWEPMLQEPLVAAEGWGHFKLGSYTLHDALSVIPGKVYPAVAASDEHFEIELAYVDKAVKLKFTTSDGECRRSLNAGSFPVIFRQILQEREVFLDANAACAQKMTLALITVTEYEHFPVVAPFVLDNQVLQAFGQNAGSLMLALEGRSLADAPGAEKLAEAVLGDDAEEGTALAQNVLSLVGGLEGKNARIDERKVRLTAGGALLRLDRPARTRLDLVVEGDDLPRVDRVVLFPRH